MPAEDVSIVEGASADPHESSSAGSLGVAPDPVPTVPSAEVGTIAGVASVSDSGAAQYSIPIEVPPGIAGMEPSIALEYSSSGGDGYAGVGWWISGFSSITRCRPNLRDDDRDGALRFDNSDPLCLDGMRLVAVDGVSGADGTEYRTRVDYSAAFRAELDALRTEVATPGTPLNQLLVGP